MTRGDGLVFAAGLLLLVAAFAPRALRRTAPPDLTLFVDVSRSHGRIDELLTGALRAAVAGTAGGSPRRTEVVAFAAGARSLGVFSGGPENIDRSVLLEAAGRLPAEFRAGTSEAALLRALEERAARERAGEALVFSDGRMPAGWRDRLPVSGRHFTRLRFAGPAAPPAEDLCLRAAGGPPFHAGVPAVVRLAIDGHFLTPRRIAVRIQDETRVLDIHPAGARGLEAALIPRGPRVEMEIVDPGGPDADPANNRLSFPAPPPGVLRVAVSGGDREAVVAALGGEPGIVPFLADGLGDGADVAVLANAPLAGDAGTPAAAQRAALDAVRLGRGIVVFGGPEAYAAGGYAGSPLGDALPLRSEPPGGRAVQVALDRSGSMERGGRWSRAVEAIRVLAASLAPGDRLQVHPFSGTLHDPVLPEPASPRDFVQLGWEALAGQFPSGPTNLKSLLPLFELEPGSGRELVLLILTDFDDPEVAGDPSGPSGQALGAAVRRFGGTVRLLLLDPAERTVRGARELGFDPVLLADVGPRVLLREAHGESWIAGPAPLVFRGALAGTAGEGVALGWNPVTLAPGAREAAVHGGTGAPLVATQALGAGRMAAAAIRAADPVAAGGLIASLVRSVAPDRRGEWDLEVREGGAILRGPPDEEGPLVFETAGGGVPLTERTAGVWTAPLMPAWQGVLTREGEALALIEASPAVDPEYAHPPDAEPAEWTGPRLATGREGFVLRPVLIGAALLLWVAGRIERQRGRSGRPRRAPPANPAQ